MKAAVWLGICVALLFVIAGVGQAAVNGAATAGRANGAQSGPTSSPFPNSGHGALPVRGDSPVRAPEIRPIPVGSGDSPQPYGSYEDGLVWDPSAATDEEGTVIQTEVQIPSADPALTDLNDLEDESWGVYLEAWDNNLSFDNIGVTFSAGVWYLSYQWTYSYVAGCSGVGDDYYQGGLFATLQPGVYYTIGMYFSEGYLFWFWQQAGEQINYFYLSTGGSFFYLSNNICNVQDAFEGEYVNDAQQTNPSDFYVPDFLVHMVGGLYDGQPIKGMGFIVGPGCASGGGGKGCDINTTTANGAGGRALEVWNIPFAMNFYATFQMEIFLPYNFGDYTFEIGVTALAGAPEAHACTIDTSSSGGLYFRNLPSYQAPPYIGTWTLSYTGSPPSPGQYVINPSLWDGSPLFCNGGFTYVTLIVDLVGP